MKLIEKTFQPHILLNSNLKLNYMKIFMKSSNQTLPIKKTLSWAEKKNLVIKLENK
jgi:hypothetical protein